MEPKIGSKVIVKNLESPEYAPLNGRIGWVIGCEKQRRLFSSQVLTGWQVRLSSCPGKTFTLNSCNLQTLKTDDGTIERARNMVRWPNDPDINYGLKVVVFGLRSCEDQMATTGLRSFEQQIEPTKSSLNGEKGWAIAYDQDNSELFVGFPGRGSRVCRIKYGNLASRDAIHFGTKKRANFGDWCEATPKVGLIDLPSDITSRICCEGSRFLMSLRVCKHFHTTHPLNATRSA